MNSIHSTKKPVTTMLTYPWKCTVLHYNHLGNTWKPLVLMTRHFDYCPSTSEGDNQSVESSAPVVSRCFPGGYNVKLYISRGRLAWWLLAFLHSDHHHHHVPSSCRGLDAMVLHSWRCCACLAAWWYSSPVHLVRFVVHFVLSLPRPLGPFTFPSKTVRCSVSPFWRMMCPKY